jgi:hypothetical protein
MLIPKPLPGESKPAFRAFKLYCELPPDERSYRTVARRLQCSTENIRKFAARNRWQDRVTILMAEEQERIADAERAAALAAAKERERLRTRHIDRMLRLAEGCWEKLEQFRNLPIVKSRKTEEIKDDEGRVIQQTILVEPTNINWSSFARVTGELDKLTRLALGMPTGKTELTNVDGTPLAVGPGNQPIINVILTRDEQSEKVDAIQKEFLEAHPDHPQAARILREYGERNHGNGEP